jgi:uncharacterized protein (UPF0335 family)
MNTAPSPIPPSLQLVQWEQFKPFIDRMERLERELAAVKALQSEWVDTKEALRITGIKSGDTLKRLRERPDAVIVVKLEGKTSKQPRYLRSSLIAYNETRRDYSRQPAVATRD